MRYTFREVLFRSTDVCLLLPSPPEVPFEMYDKRGLLEVTVNKWGSYIVPVRFIIRRYQTINSYVPLLEFSFDWDWFPPDNTQRQVYDSICDRILHSITLLNDYGTHDSRWFRNLGIDSPSSS